MTYRKLVIVLQLLLLAALAWHEAAGTVCFVGHSSATLGQCFRNESVTDIILQEDHAIGQVDYASAPLMLRRNVTVRGPAGKRSEDRPVLDLGFLNAAVEICSSCTVTFRDLVMKNERRGTGAAFDMFMGQPGSKVESINVYRWRPACTPAGYQVKALTGLKRSSLFANSTAPQQVEVQNVQYRGKVYADSVLTVDVSFDVGVRPDEGPGSGQNGGYAQLSLNNVRLCEAYVSKDCLAVHTADTCISQLVDGSTTAAKPPGLAPSAAVAIIIPLAAGFLGASALAIWWLRRRCRHHPPGPGGASGLKCCGTRRGGCTPACAGHTDSEFFSPDPSGPSVGGFTGKPLAINTGSWELLDSKTSPLLGAVENNTVELGTLLGAGSFGKVFKGRWNGMDVAVKVVEHSGSSPVAVQHEMEIMMSFQHTNIVRALHCITYVHKEGLESDYSASITTSRNNSGAMGSSQPRPLLPSKTSGSFTAARCVHSSAASVQSVAAGASAAAPAAASGLANFSPASGPLARLSLLVAPAAAASGSAGVSAELSGCSAPCCSSTSPCCAADDTVLTITEGAASSQQQPRVCGCGCCGAAGAGAAATAHIDMQASSKAAPMDASFGARCSSSDSSGCGSRQFRPCLTDSIGSSVDCRCVPQQLKSAKSLKETEHRYESWLVLELCDKGNLSSYLSNWPAPGVSSCGGTLLQLLKLLQDTGRGLQELHQQQVVHGDLNARNVLVASDAAGGVHAKLADLGLSRTIREHRRHRTTNTVGTMSHMPPEVLRSGYLSVAADVYALGIMMWELYTGEDAFQRLQHPGQFFETVVLQDLRPVIPQGMPADYQLLMQHCWATEPDTRPSISRVLECLQYMITERQQGAASATNPAGPARAVVSAPLPTLLQSPPPRKQHWWQHQQLQRLSLLKVLGSDTSQSHVGSASVSQASSGALPSVALPGMFASPNNSNSLLPVLDVEEPTLSSQALDSEPPAPLPQPQPQEQEHVPAGYVSQPLPSAFAAGSFSFYRRFRPSRPSIDAVAREDSTDRKSSSSGKLSSVLQNVRQASFSMREFSLSFSSSRNTSWSARAGSQTGSLGDHAWFV